jgi:hypothetical protein
MTSTVWYWKISAQSERPSSSVRIERVGVALEVRPRKRLVPVAETVAIGVRIVRIGAEPSLLTVGQTVVVGVHTGPAVVVVVDVSCKGESTTATRATAMVSRAFVSVVEPSTVAGAVASIAAPTASISASSARVAQA